MKVVHLLRKPCSEGTVAANVLRHGTGALNIDASRVAFTSKADEQESKTKNQHADFGSAPVTGNVTYGDYSMMPQKNYNPPGRWPANLVLQHLDGCEQTGTREEAGYTVNRFTDGAKPFGGGAGHPYESVAVPPSTVAVWTCAEGCPVAALDEQSGDRPTGKGGGAGMGFHGGAGEPSAGRGFGDTEGASRFFKQFGG